MTPRHALVRLPRFSLLRPCSTNTNLYLPHPHSAGDSFYLLAQIEEINLQFVSGEIKKAHARVYSTYTCALLYHDCMQTLSFLPKLQSYYTEHTISLSPRKKHGIINCRRRQLAVTCRCRVHLLVPKSALTLLGHGDFFNFHLSLVYYISWRLQVKIG